MDRAAVAGPIRRDFFISYAGHDRAWAEWVGWELTESSYSVDLDFWDWHSGDNFVSKISQAIEMSNCVVCLLSSAYLEAGRYTEIEWTSAFVQMQQSSLSILPVRIEKITPPAIFAALISLDLFDMPESAARTELARQARAITSSKKHQPSAIRPERGRITRPNFPTSRPRIWNLPPRNQSFSGRDRILVKIREGLSGSGTTVITALEGMADVGKTQLAIEYAHRARADYDIGWWVASEQPALIRDQLALLAVRLGVSTRNDSPELAISLLREELGRRPKWLIVFDNVQDSKTIQPFLPSGAGHVLITSRSGRWAEVADPIVVSLFSKSESSSFLRSRVPHLNQDERNSIAENLGHLPLALSQASAFIIESRVAATEYLNMLSLSAASMMREGTPPSYPNSLAASLELSMRALGSSDNEALKVLQACAFLAPEPVPLLSVVSPGNRVTALRDKLSAVRVIRALGNCKLATVDSRGVQLHRLTQAVIRDLLGPTDQVDSFERAQHLLASADPGDPDDPATWESWSVLVPHLLLIGSRAISTTLCKLTCNAATYLLARGEIEIAKSFLQELNREWSTSRGSDDEESLRVANYLARAHSDSGDFELARGLDADVLERRTRILGTEHVDTLETAYNLGADLVQLELHEQATRINMETLARLEARYGVGDFHTYAVQSLLARSKASLGDHREAARLMTDVFEQYEKNLGLGHPDSVRTATRLASYLRLSGQASRAAELSERAYKASKLTVGVNHQTTLAIAAELAVDLHVLGDRARAFEIASVTLKRTNRNIRIGRPALTKISDILTTIIGDAKERSSRQG